MALTRKSGCPALVNACSTHLKRITREKGKKLTCVIGNFDHGRQKRLEIRCGFAIDMGDEVSGGEAILIRRRTPCPSRNVHLAEELADLLPHGMVRAMENG